MNVFRAIGLLIVAIIALSMLLFLSLGWFIIPFWMQIYGDLDLPFPLPMLIGFGIWWLGWKFFGMFRWSPSNDRTPPSQS